MPDELEHRERKRMGPGCVVAGLFFLPVLYALSPPFVILMFDLKPGPGNTVFNTVYAPLFWMVINIDFVSDFYRWYFRLFGLH